MSDLKLCPFCGGKAETLVVNGGLETNEVYTQCCGCGARTKQILIYMDEDSRVPLSAILKAATDAEECWNRRAEDD